MVNIAGTLPKGEGNGLEAHSQRLAKSMVAGEKFLVVGVVATASVKTTVGDLVPTPTVAFTRVELVEPGTELEDAAVRVLQAAQDARLGGNGQQSFGFSGRDAAADEEAEPETLALAEGPGYYFQVRDLPAGRFGLYLCTQYVEGVAKRGNLLRSELGEVAPGDYQLIELPDSLRGIASVLIEEWETNTGTSLVDDQVVDAEVIEEDDNEEEEEQA